VGFKTTAEDAYADMSQPPPFEEGTETQQTDSTNFVQLWGLSAFSNYLYAHDAQAAALLLFAIQRHLDMAGNGKNEAGVALTAAVWKDAGVPPEAKRTRNTLLAHLHRLPELVTIREDRTPYFRYRIKRGPAWRQMEVEAGRKNGKA
jgi:hypothetical protein